MSQIIKTEAIVISKLNFRESSNISKFYTKDFGVVTGIIKGARGPKSKIGSIIDILNYVEIVFYKKDSRDIQLVSQANLISHFSKVKNNLEKLKYASAINELILHLVPENEANDKIFRGFIKVLSLLNEDTNDEKILFAKFFLFLIKEIGYELSLNNCSICEKSIESDELVSFNYTNGVVCSGCSRDKQMSFEFSKEHFDLFKCLTTKSILTEYNNDDLDKILFSLERYLIYHIPEFKGIKSLKMF